MASINYVAIISKCYILVLVCALITGNMQARISESEVVNTEVVNVKNS